MIARGALTANRLPSITPDGAMNATAMIFAEGATLGNGRLSPVGISLAESVLFAEGVIFAERGTTAITRLTFVGQSALGSEQYFSQGLLFSESELRVLFASPNNVLVAGEAFIYY